MFTRGEGLPGEEGIWGMPSLMGYYLSLVSAETILLFILLFRKTITFSRNILREILGPIAPI